jgi:hypothetical protein
MSQIRMTVLSLTVVIALYGILAATNLLRFVRAGETGAEYNHAFRAATFFLLCVLCWLWSRKTFASLWKRSEMLVVWGALGGALCGDLAYVTMLIWEHIWHGRFKLADVFDPPLWAFIPILSGTWFLGIVCLTWFESVRACIPSQSNLHQASAIAP